MAQTHPTTDELLRENAELRLRLMEAEETLEAIRTGQVDAFVVSGSDEETIFTLTSADHPYRRFVEAMQEGAVTLSDDGTILFCNEYFASLLKIPAKSVMGTPFGELVSEQDRGAYEALQTGGRVEVHLHSVDTDGIPVALIAHTLVTDDEDNVRCLLVLDLTEQKRHEELKLSQAALRESEQRFRVMANTAPAMLWITDPEGECTFLSRGWYDYTGQTEADGLGLGWTQATHPDDQAAAAKRFQAANSSREPFRLEYRLRHVDGDYRWVIDTGRPRFADDTGEFLGFIGSVIDIHERKNAEQLLRASHDIFFNLIQRAPFGVYVVDHKLRMRQISAGSQEVFSGIRPLIGRPLGEVMRSLWPETFAAEVVERFQHTLATGEPYRKTDMTQHRADVDTIESYDWQLERVTLPDGHFGVVCYFYNMTELRRAEQALRDADRRKDEFLAMLAHELRNPLAPLRTGLELMKMSSDPKELEETRAVMERQMRQLVALVDDLMDVSRITRGKLELRKCQMQLQDVVQSAVEASRDMIERAGHTLDVVLPQEPIILDADPHRLAQILSNLLNNAAKYTPDNGHIRLHAEQHEGEAVIRVKDNGIGIPPEMRGRIFDMFEQVEQPSEKGNSGLGIGLTLVRSLVQLHGGSIELSSSDTESGCEFWVRLPLPTTVQESQSPQGSEAAAAHNSNRRVLIVDDNRPAADMLSTLVGILGNHVRTAYDGQQAIDIAADFLPHVVLMDVGMPRMNGHEAARRMRQQPWGRDIRLIALTGWGQEADRQQTKNAGFDLHVVKPVEPDRLMELLKDN